VRAESLPLHEAVASVAPGPGGLSLALAASDDYELLFAVPRRRQRAFRAAARQAGAPITEIGCLRQEPGVTLLVEGSERPWPTGYEHFAA
jgi:thiamine-monophosphate kinase